MKHEFVIKLVRISQQFYFWRVLSFRLQFYFWSKATEAAEQHRQNRTPALLCFSSPFYKTNTSPSNQRNPKSKYELCPMTLKSWYKRFDYKVALRIFTFLYEHREKFNEKEEKPVFLTTMKSKKAIVSSMHKEYYYITRCNFWWNKKVVSWLKVTPDFFLDINK